MAVYHPRTRKLQHAESVLLAAPQLATPAAGTAGRLRAAPRTLEERPCRTGPDGRPRHGHKPRLTSLTSPGCHASFTYGCSLCHIRLQPHSHTVAASVTYGCRLLRVVLDARGQVTDGPLLNTVPPAC